jgi:hypothetical protein
MAVRFALVAFAVLAVAAGRTGPSPVFHETVWLRGNAPAHGLLVTENVAGYCTSPARSTPRAYAWRCFADEHFIDPCFSATPRSRMVVCPFDPWTKSVRLVSLTRRLPRWVERRERRNVPWGIWTANAKRCVLAVSGATLRLAGQRVRYECAGSGFLVGYAQVRARGWTIGYVPRYDLGNPHLHLREIGITDVWR